jgi:hypothetical protein
MLTKLAKRAYSTQWWRSIPEITREAQATKVKEQDALVDETVATFKKQIEDESSWIGSSLKRAATEGKSSLNVYYYQLGSGVPHHTRNTDVAKKLNDLFNPTLKFDDISSPHIARHMSIHWSHAAVIDWAVSDSCPKK